MAAGLAAGLTATAGTPAAAQDLLGTSWYGEVRAGVLFPFDLQGDFQQPDLTDTSVSADFDADTGWIAAAAFGRQFNWFRLELELNYRTNEVTSVEFFGLDDSASDVLDEAFGSELSESIGVQVDGDFRSLSGMVNVYADVVSNGVIRPYIGAGIGGALTDFQLDTPAIDGVFDDGGGSFVWQVMAGFGFYFTPDSAFTLGARYVETVEDDFNADSDDFALEFEPQFTGYSLEAGYRHHF